MKRSILLAAVLLNCAPAKNVVRPGEPTNVSFVRVPREVNHLYVCAFPHDVQNLACLDFQEFVRAVQK